METRGMLDAARTVGSSTEYFSRRMFTVALNHLTFQTQRHPESEQRL